MDPRRGARLAGALDPLGLALGMDGAVLLVSQFTLLGDARGQNRPGWLGPPPPPGVRQR